MDMVHIPGYPHIYGYGPCPRISTYMDMVHIPRSISIFPYLFWHRVTEVVHRSELRSSCCYSIRIRSPLFSDSAGIYPVTPRTVRQGGRVALAPSQRRRRGGSECGGGAGAASDSGAAGGGRSRVDPGRGPGPQPGSHGGGPEPGPAGFGGRAWLRAERSRRLGRFRPTCSPVGNGSTESRSVSFVRPVPPWPGEPGRGAAHARTAPDAGPATPPPARTAPRPSRRPVASDDAEPPTAGFNPDSGQCLHRKVNGHTPAVLPDRHPASALHDADLKGWHPLSVQPQPGPAAQ